MTAAQQNPQNASRRGRRTRIHFTLLALVAAILGTFTALAPAASAAINRSSCTVYDLSFNHTAGAGYWAHTFYDCSHATSGPVTATMQVKENGVVIQSSPPYPYTTAIETGAPIPPVVHGAYYQIVETFSGGLGYATSGDPQILAA